MDSSFLAISTRLHSMARDSGVHRNCKQQHTATEDGQHHVVTNSFEPGGARWQAWGGKHTEHGAAATERVCAQGARSVTQSGVVRKRLVADDMCEAHKMRHGRVCTPLPHTSFAASFTSKPLAADRESTRAMSPRAAASRRGDQKPWDTNHKPHAHHHHKSPSRITHHTSNTAHI